MCSLFASVGAPFGWLTTALLKQFEAFGVMVLNTLPSLLALGYVHNKLPTMNDLHGFHLLIVLGDVFPGHLRPKYPGSLVDTAFPG